MKKTLIKVCGITDINDMKYASNIEDIDYLGIIFAKESPRCVDLNLAEKLINACDKTKNIVAVFMNQSKEDIEHVIKNLDFNILQFHGHESVDFCNFFKKPFIKTFHTSFHILLYTFIHTFYTILHHFYTISHI